MARPVDSYATGKQRPCRKRVADLMEEEKMANQFTNNTRTSGCTYIFGALTPLVVLLATALPARAQETGDAAAGRRIAETWCSTCHVVGPSVKQGVSNGAPPFPAVAQMKSTTPMSLRVFLQTPHARMPDLHLTRDEIDDLSAYILSLRHK